VGPDDESNNWAEGQDYGQEDYSGRDADCVHHRVSLVTKFLMKESVGRGATYT
jgi:hypothetical protein